MAQWLLLFLYFTHSLQLILMVGCINRQSKKEKKRLWYLEILSMDHEW